MGTGILRWVLAVLLLALGSSPAFAQQRNLSVSAVALQIPGERPIQLYGDSYALVIGASAYTNGWPRLAGVLADVREVSRALKDQGFKVTQLLNPTLAQLEGGLRKFIAENGEDANNRLLIYFAGHGHTLKSADGRQLGYIVPVDAPTDRNPGAFKSAALSMETIESFAKQINAKHALFLFDSCFSGTFFKMRAVPETIGVKTAQPVRQFITAGGADQQVPDVSVFRQQFIAAIKGEADSNHDGYVTGSELGMFLEDKVTNYSRGTQVPQYGKIRDPNLDKGDFVFVLGRQPSRPDVIAPAAGGAIDPLAVELSYWESVKDSKSADELKAYLESYPRGQFAPLARARLRSLETAGLPTQSASAPTSAAQAAAAPPPVQVATAAPSTAAARPLAAEPQPSYFAKPPSSSWSPSRLVRVIVPYAPGGSTDIVGRVIAQALSSAVGQTVIIDNRPGAGGMIGAQAIAQSAPDGYSLLLATSGMATMNPALYSRMPFSMEQDLVPIVQVSESPVLLVVHPAMAKGTPAELARRSLTYASSGVGSYSHLIAEKFLQGAGGKWTHIPYKGTAPALLDLITGQVQAMFIDVAIALPQIKNGKLTAVAVTSKRRVASMPDVPTFTELGMPNMQLGTWIALFAPAGTPTGVINRWYHELSKVLATAQVRERFAALGLEVTDIPPDPLKQQIRSETAAWTSVVKTAGIALIQ